MTSTAAAPVVLGIDLGTTGVKAWALDVAGATVVERATVEYPPAWTEGGAHEQDPQDWWRAAAEACRAVGAGREIAAVGLSGQMHSLLLVDDRGRPLHRAMTWADRRVGEATARLAATGLFRPRGGNDPVDAFTAPKLAWLAERDPQLVRSAHRLILAKDWLGFRLTGRIATDTTDALGTLLWNPDTGAWDPDLFAACGADPSLGPEVLSSTDVLGAVTAAAAEATGIPAGTSVVIGAGDVSAVAFGAGAALGEAMCLNAGTAAQVMGVTPALDPGPGFAFGSADGSGYVCMASVYAAGASVREFERRELDGGFIGDVEGAARRGADGAVFLPFMFGASVPRKNDSVRGGFFDVGPRHGVAERAAAVLEGVAFACADAVDAVASVAGPVPRLTIVGGVTGSARFRDALAAVVDREVVHMPDAGSTLGACVCAAIGIGAARDVHEVLDGLPSHSVAAPSSAPAYRESRARFAAHVDRLV